MNTPSAREARKNKNGDDASTLIHVILVNLGEVPETIETTQMVVSGAEAPESAAPIT